MSPLNPFPKRHIIEGCKAGLCRGCAPSVQAVCRWVGFRSAHRGYLHALILDSQCFPQQLISQLPVVALLSFSPWERHPCEWPGGQSTQSTSCSHHQQLGESELCPCLWQSFSVGTGLWHHGVESLPLLHQNMRHFGSQMCSAALLEPTLRGCLRLGCGFSYENK